MCQETLQNTIKTQKPCGTPYKYQCTDQRPLIVTKARRAIHPFKALSLWFVIVHFHETVIMLAPTTAHFIQLGQVSNNHITTKK